jgi:ribosomal protein L11 methyltransferase
MKWIEVSIITTIEALEAVANILYEAGVTGVVIEDWESNMSYAEISEDKAIVKGYLPLDSTTSEKIQEIRESVDRLAEYNLTKGKGEIKLTEISDEDWAESWKKYYKPIKVGEKIVVKPTWEDYQPVGGEIIIELDPGMAFGTGTHETTRMCLEVLEDNVKHGDLVIDVGCGSGILSIAAAKLGAGKVIGLDVDRVAVNIAKENIRLNCVEEVVEIKEGDLLEGISLKGDIVISNIVTDVIKKLAPKVPLNLRTGGIFIASGIIKERIMEVRKAVEKNGFDIIEEKEKGDWITIICKLAS